MPRLATAPVRISLALCAALGVAQLASAQASKGAVQGVALIGTWEWETLDTLPFQLPGLDITRATVTFKAGGSILYALYVDGEPEPFVPDVTARYALEKGHMLRLSGPPGGVARLFTTGDKMVWHFSDGRTVRLSRLAGPGDEDALGAPTEPGAGGPEASGCTASLRAEVLR